MAQSSFNIEPVFYYLSERFQIQRFVPLAFILYLGYLLCVDFYPVKPSNLVTLLLLILSFRLMDDLFDLQYDRNDFPERTLSKTKDTKLFVIFLIALYLLLALFLLREKNLTSLCLLPATILFLCAWYTTLRNFFNSRLLHSLVVLTKYPLFIYIIAPGLTRTEIPVLLYLTFLLFEIQDDPELKSNVAAQGIQTISLFAYLILLFFLLALPSKSMASWFVLIISLGLQAALLIRKSVNTAYIPFLNTLLLFVFLSAKYFLK